ncbi:DUF5610 domain-containing protein [Marinobacterium iners]|uniref:DUF5610 domain-containing protein n=1 Tax=Marinobacterium iners DSM 11526 TaxID=1122198 RepID=A0A1H4ERB4_9GAMM|nr:DUF5610 domain-containing protein [Marinobacterium iners]SEA87409.1 hypothetical protein SAMN02745729_10925 [Marinobacterium iners DSM 11526]
MKIQSPPTQIYSSRPQSVPVAERGNGKSQDATQVLLGKLAEKIPGMTTEKLSGLDAQNFTPDKVAGRISDFVAAGLAAAKNRGASDERLQQMYDAALKGVETGFKEAREILDNLNVLQGDIKTQVDETEQKTFDALAEIAPGSRDAVAQAVLGAAERYRNAEDMSLTVKTQDGDEVTINFSRNQSYDATYGAGADSQGNSVAWMDVSRSESTQYQFSVKGELDEGEIEALQQMVRDISGVADEFFNGDVQKAFEQSAGIRFDSSELSSMDLSMSYSRSLSQAASYEQVGSLEQPADKPGLRLGQLMKDLAESVGAPSLGFLQSPSQAGRDLMTGLVEQDGRFSDAIKELQDSYRNNLKQLLDTVLPLKAEPAAESAAENGSTDKA